MNAPKIIRGFAEPVRDSQQTFRQLLKAMSEPGSVVNLTSPDALTHLYSSTFAVCQALLDQQTPLWLSPEFNTADIRHNLHFHSGMPITDEPAKALFAIAYPGEITAMSEFSIGSCEYPETGCTLILQVNSVSSELTVSGLSAKEPSSGLSPLMSKQALTSLKLSGPGIATEKLIHISDLNDVLINYLVERPDSFPLGIDLVFVAEQSLVCIPRTTTVEVL
ncbi:phosphonate C-P lyase system protein PhnH [Neptunomonas antarctica]|uniref:Methylphosphonate degradation complex, subunit phnH n=1 Tax=Neptunomonas antarctica TaxID=619304 RepID=A0A1N7JUK0_9GAMM|nr:phosphonate C-P lyase system protein PhnH [Neptunomonas antarctica]SIS52884.1 methylphosphonate degradation complex, subunit phnH [Neptunomonas antarctica]